MQTSATGVDELILDTLSFLKIGNVPSEDEFRGELGAMMQLRVEMSYNSLATFISGVEYAVRTTWVGYRV